jgi:hypothetical protein
MGFIMQTFQHKSEYREEHDWVGAYKGSYAKLYSCVRSNWT